MPCHAIPCLILPPILYYLAAVAAAAAATKNQTEITQEKDKREKQLKKENKAFHHNSYPSFLPSLLPFHSLPLSHFSTPLGWEVKPGLIEPKNPKQPTNPPHT
ncbi:hypothetical protein VTJ04DRAFT_9972 [Mycothermus thermophilus]|uniref:uncharacterized protein n=1 Tax=Humicola insolens TaxID=85995 RepID=UPI003743DDA4